MAPVSAMSPDHEGSTSRDASDEEEEEEEKEESGRLWGLGGKGEEKTTEVFHWLGNFFRGVAANVSDWLSSARKHVHVPEQLRRLARLCSLSRLVGGGDELEGGGAGGQRRFNRFSRLLYRKSRYGSGGGPLGDEIGAAEELRLSEAEAGLVQLSWRLLTVAAPGKSLPGAAIFKRIFECAPELKTTFGLPEEPSKRLPASEERFHHHVQAFTNLLDFAVLHVHKLQEKVVPRLHALGRRHAAMAEMGFDAAYFGLFESAILDYIQVSLKSVNRVHTLSASLQSLNSIAATESVSASLREEEEEGGTESSPPPSPKPLARAIRVSSDPEPGLASPASRGRLNSTTSVATLSQEECCVALAQTIAAWETFVAFLIRHIAHPPPIQEEEKVEPKPSPASLNHPTELQEQTETNLGEEDMDQDKASLRQDPDSSS